VWLAVDNIGSALYSFGMDLKNFTSKRNELEKRRYQLLKEVAEVEKALGIGRRSKPKSGVIADVFEFCRGKSEVSTRDIRGCVIATGRSKENVGPVVVRLLRMGVLVRKEHGLYEVVESAWRP